ncbi:MAG: hypothetical protein GQ542_21190, partial [Desulforhopalus sp.]|nr:hypothetical protein [Desulforhopalus sp.]
MMKISAVCFLLICGLIILLATVDLEPYLAPDLSDISKQVPPPVSKTDEPPSKPTPSKQTETPSTVISDVEAPPTQSEDSKLEDLFENMKAAAAMDEITTEREHAATPPMAKVDEIAEGVEQEHTSSALLELEVTILPEDEYPFSILLETFLEQEIAQQAIDLYQDRDISAHWVKVNLGEKGIRYRLFTGIFATIPEAQQYLDQNQLFDKLIKPTYYSARVGVYQDQAQLANAFVKARDTGFIPYILGTKKAVYHLYVGAFYTYTGATSQCRALTDAGLSCEPVRR